MPWSVTSLPDSVKNKDWSDHQKEIFVKAANAALEEYKDDGKAIAVGTAAAEKEHKNARQYPQIFYARHMLPGIVGYENENILVDADAMKRAAPSMVGKPLYVQHQKVNLDTLEHDADGWIVDNFYNELDGWLWAKCLAVTDEAHRAIESKWSVSNAFVPVDWEGEGQHLNVDYDRKIRNYKFTHLAIVPNPRYEEAKIFSPDEFKSYQEEKRKQLDELQNSKPQRSHPMLKFWKKITEELTNGIPADADLTQIEVETATGKRMPLSEIINALENAKKNEDEEKKKKEEDEKSNKKPKLNADTKVTVGDEEMPMSELMCRYNKMEKENAEEEEKKKKDEEEEKAKKEKENALKQKKVDEITNAGGKHVTGTKPRVETMMDKVARGKKLYS